MLIAGFRIEGGGGCAYFNEDSGIGEVGLCEDLLHDRLFDGRGVHCGEDYAGRPGFGGLVSESLECSGRWVERF